MKKFARVFLALTLVTCVFASTAGAAIFPITKKLNDITVYMPLRIHMAWSNGSEVPGNLEMEGGERREIYIDVADTNENGQIDAEDFSLAQLSGTIKINDGDISGLRELIDELALAISDDKQGEDANKHDYDWLLKNTPSEYSDTRDEIENLVDQYVEDIENHSTVNYSLGTVIGGSNNSNNSLLDVSSAFAEISPAAIASEFAKSPSRLTIARAYVTAKQPAGNQGSNYDPEFVTLSLTLGFSGSNVNQAYKDTFSEHPVSTPMVNVEIRAHDSGGGGCNAVSGLLGLFMLVPTIICGKRE